jgi:CO dehydrogenase maturation factor
MRVAFVGKGGGGKSVIAGTLARLLAAEGTPVLAIDSDPLPGLALSIGVERSDAGIPDEAVEEAPQGERPPYRLRAGLTPTEAVRRYAAHGPDGIRFLQFGKLRGAVGELRRSQFAFQQITAGLPADEWAIVGDVPGGTRQPFMGWGAYARTLLVVVEPTAPSLLTARRLARLRDAGGAPDVVAVATKVTDAADGTRVAERTGLPVIAEIPYDEAVRDADRMGLPPIDVAPDAPAVRAVASLLQRLRREDERV